MAGHVDPYRNDDVQPDQSYPPYGESPYGFPTSTPPGPYLSDGDGSRRRVAGPSSDDRDPFLVRLWRRITGSR